MVGVLSENYIRTARAYGLPNWYILYRLALKNAIIPAIILLGLMFAGAFIGVFFVETVYGLPGIGTLATTSINNLDYPVIVGVVIFVSIAFVLVNFVVDVAQTQIDRRTLGR
jgi:peptide/nickel transport system permease protein